VNKSDWLASRHPQTTLPEHDSFTLVFSGDLRKFRGNPFHTDTPFGRPTASSIGDAIENENLAVEEGSRLLEALRACRLELFWCAQQLADRGMKGHPDDSVSRALRLADEAMATNETPR